MVAFVLRISFMDTQQKVPTLDLMLCDHCLQILICCEQVTSGSHLALGPENCLTYRFNDTRNRSPAQKTIVPSEFKVLVSM